MRASNAEHQDVHRLDIRASAALALYALIPLVANWMIGDVGAPIPNGPHVLPVWPGVVAPSGVYVVGVAFLLRDYVQEVAGRRGAVLAILAGTAVSYLVASPTIAVASCAAFLVSEACDLAVYTPLRERAHWLAAVIGSNVVGLVVDSVLFLGLAFGSLDLLPGQVIGKLWASLLFLMILGARRVWRRAKVDTDGCVR